MVFDAELATGDFPKVLAQLAERFVRAVLRDDNIATYRLITAEASRFPELGRAFYSSGPQRSRDKLADLFARATTDGELKTCDPRMMAGRFFELCKGELHQRKLWGIAEPTDKEIRAHVADAVAVFLAAYGRNIQIP
jgi:TetR/AcrR family transcriptional repressor of mexJK operon